MLSEDPEKSSVPSAPRSQRGKRRVYARGPKLTRKILRELERLKASIASSSGRPRQSIGGTA